MNSFAHVLAVFCALVLGASASAQSVPPGYPADYQAIIAGAEQEGSVVVYSATNSASADALLKDFRALYPKVQLRYHDLNSTEIYNRYLSETAANAETADVLWSGSMDLQLKLVAEGHALTLSLARVGENAEMGRARGSRLGHDLRAVGDRLQQAAVARRRACRARTPISCACSRSEPQFFAGGKLTTYDPEKSGFAFMLMTQDEKYFPQFWELASAFGRGTGRFYPSSGTMIERITSGEHLLGFNVIGSYVVLRQRKDPDLGLVYPGDYVLVMSRVAIHHQECASVRTPESCSWIICSPRARRRSWPTRRRCSRCATTSRGRIRRARWQGAGQPPQADPGRYESPRRAGAGQAPATIRKWQETARAQ